MGVFTVPFCSRESSKSQRTSFAVGVALVLAVSLPLTSSAQDRVILFESLRQSGTSVLPGEIREVVVSQDGRGSSVVRAAGLPAHDSVSPVSLADGSRVVWLALTATSTILVQYEVATGRASIVDIGSFDRTAFLVSDKSAVRIFVVEPTRVTFIDTRLQPESIAFSGAKRIISASTAGGYLLLQRISNVDDAELLLIDTQTKQIARTLQVGVPGKVLAARNGQVAYRAYYDTPSNQRRLDILSLTDGQVLARAADVSYVYLLELDEQRGIVIHDHSLGHRQVIVIRDAATLAILGELSPGNFDGRRDFKLAQTRTEATALFYSREAVQGIFDSCQSASPRIDVFSGTTSTLVNRIDLQGRCPQILPVPPR